MKQKSPFELASDLQGQVRRIVSAFDVDSLPAAERTLLLLLRRLATDVRLDIRAYGTAETAAEQQRLAREMRERLKQLDEAILQAGSLNLMGAADVAQLSATTQQLMSDL
ncbi:MAG TPA: hypothetical protein VLH86_00985 [Patescibacteria group bacterium]|nr:hypothetical protein [Patescibacteria group bacterium]